MAPPEGVPSATATVTDLAAARRDRARDTESAATTGPRADDTGSRAGAADGTRKTANRRFDAEKVARLKAEIAAGRYRVDAESVAERFIEHERNG